MTNEKQAFNGVQNYRFTAKESLVENEKQRRFYERIGANPDLSHYTDGVFKGNIFENKRVIINVYETLSQAIKYASRIRIRGEKLPSNIILNDLINEKVYIFKSADLLPDIEKVYFGAASKNNNEYKTNIQPIEISYKETDGLQTLLQYINQENFVKYHVDKTNIVGLSVQFYKYNQDKDKFIKDKFSEIRKPTILADRIYPYQREDNLEFEDIMDCLNPALLQREQGAYYTPVPYVKKMHELLYKAIAEIPKGMDYVIIDRCAGTGNLQEGLPDEILKHCILSTIEYNEHAILNYKYGGKCSVAVPNIDALAYDIIPAECNMMMMNEVINDYVRERIEDENCVIILMENPPFSEVAAGSVQNTGKKVNEWKKSYVYNKMSSEEKGVVLNDLSNLFIWSGFKYYLRNEYDNYILYSPSKYWRNQHLVNKKFGGGFLCNRKEFHASDKSAIACIRWINIKDDNTKELVLTPYDIDGEDVVRAADDVTIKKAFRTFTDGFDKRKFPDDRKDGIICERDGREFVDNGRKNYAEPIYNPNIIAYLCASNFQIDRKDVVLTRCALYKAHGFFIRDDNFVEKLPLFVAAAYPYKKWYETNVYSKSYDGNGSYIQDNEFLKKCLIYTSLTFKNKCRTIMGSDKRFYRNELCLHKDDTLSYKKLKDYISAGHCLTEKEKELLKYWHDVLFEAQKADEYKKLMENTNFRLGLWQIKEEINVKYFTGEYDKKGKPIYAYKYTMLNTAIKILERVTEQYYEECIVSDLFKYELLK